jgi:TPR repeat protein
MRRNFLSFLNLTLFLSALNPLNLAASSNSLPGEIEKESRRRRIEHCEMCSSREKWRELIKKANGGDIVSQEDFAKSYVGGMLDDYVIKKLKVREWGRVEERAKKDDRLKCLLSKKLSSEGLKFSSLYPDLFEDIKNKHQQNRTFDIDKQLAIIFHNEKKYSEVISIAARYNLQRQINDFQFYEFKKIISDSYFNEGIKRFENGERLWHANNHAQAAQSFKECITYLENATDSEMQRPRQYVEACKYLGQYYRTTMIHNRLELEEASKYFKKAWETGSETQKESFKSDYFQCEQQLGKAYRAGTEVTKDIAKAIQKFEKALSLRETPEVETELNACYYERAEEVRIHAPDLAYQYYQKAASLGHVLSRGKLQSHYFLLANEDYNAGDYTGAIELYQKAVEEEHGMSLYYLGEAYERPNLYGRVITLNISQAISFYKRAALKNIGDAQQALVRLEQVRQYIPTDIESMEWIVRALARNNSNLMNFLITTNNAQLPLKLSYLVFTKLGERPLLCNPMPLERIQKDFIYNSIWETQVEEDFTNSVLAIDVSTNGPHETAYCVAKKYRDTYYVYASGGMEGEYIPQNIRDGASAHVQNKMLKIACKHRVEHIYVEANGGHRAFASGLTDKLRTSTLPFGALRPSIHPFPATQNKQFRINRTLKPLIDTGRLIVDREVLRKDVESVPQNDTRFKLFYQLTYFGSQPSLEFDDRLDALAMAIEKLDASLMVARRY